MSGPASLKTLAPIAGYLTLLELSVGTAVAAYVIDAAGRVGRGYVGSTAGICTAVAGVALLIGIYVPTDITLLSAPISGGAMSSLIHWNIGYVGALLVLALFCWVGTDLARRVIGAGVLAVGGVCIGKAAVAIGPAISGAGGAVAVLVPATLVTGVALAGMLLGHWYLVAPSLSFRPLRQMVRLVLGALGVESAVIAAVLLASSPGARAQLIGGYALPFWLLVIGAGIVFTALVTLLTGHFARIRANQPATAMLYVLIISVLMGVVPAHLLFFVTGTPV
ncbi:MAG TPA: hypothetical protein VF155_12295 [Candidatus Dormibacteraeota bacterium]